MPDARFKRPEDLDAATRHLIGGKAAGLLTLHRAAAPLPSWAVLPSDLAARGAIPPKEIEALYAALCPNDEGLAIRSSGLTEDQRACSSAGIYETHFCARPDEVPDALRAVMESSQTARVQAYGAGESSGMAVILQRRITPQLSGVAFSAHPACARYDRVFVEVVHGACANLVDGVASPSRFEVAIATHAVVVAIPGADGPETLDTTLAESLCRWLLRLEHAFGAALDIEWAVDASGLWLLQARPITRLALDPALRPPVAATSWFFDQRFHEPIHPITRSRLLPLILRTGIEDALRMRHMSVPEPLAFDYAGQVYVNVEAYHRILHNLPGALLTPDLRQLYPEGMHPGALPGIGLLTEGLPLLWRERHRVAGNIPTWNRFCAGLGVRLAAVPRPPATDAAAWCAAWEALDGLSEEFLQIHRWSIVLADYGYNMVNCVARCLPRSLRVRAKTQLIGRVALITAEANAARAVFVATAEPSARAEFLARYGHRSTSLDYAAPTWAEIYGNGEEATDPALEYFDSTLRVRRGVLVRLLEMREEQRFHWERILARQRNLLRSAARVLVEGGVLASPEEIWWLTWDELRAALERREMLDTAVLHRRKHEHYINLPAHRPTHVAPQRDQVAPDVRAAEASMLQGIGAAAGIATGPAVVCRRLAQIPDAFPEGAILVLPCLDPAWTPVLRSVAGLVIERGGLLSHAAIIAREYGLPLVIGVADATERIRTGDVILVDGETGTVRSDRA